MAYNQTIINYFMTDGQGDLQKSKLFNNTIEPHCLINNVNMNTLQICWSVYQVAHHIGNLFLAVLLLEDECHCLDL